MLSEQSTLLHAKTTQPTFESNKIFPQQWHHSELSSHNYDLHDIYIPYDAVYKYSGYNCFIRTVPESGPMAYVFRDKRHPQ